MAQQNFVDPPHDENQSFLPEHYQPSSGRLLETAIEHHYQGG
jgi:hypothetical protein